MSDVMSFAGVSRSTVYRWMLTEGLPFLRVGGARFIPDSVLEWASARERTTFSHQTALMTTRPGVAVTREALLALGPKE